MPTSFETAPADLLAVSRPSSLCLFGWLSMQAGGLVLSALRVRLWEHAPLAMEFFAMETLLVIQIIGAGLLSPRLADGWRSMVIAAAGVWPFAALAGLMAAASARMIVEAGAFVSTWVAVLWIWQSCCRGERQKWAVCALATTWAAAGPILVFIRSEYRFEPPQSPTPISPAISGPLMSAITLLKASILREKLVCWACLGALAAVGGGVKWVSQLAFLRWFKIFQTLP